MRRVASAFAAALAGMTPVLGSAADAARSGAEKLRGFGLADSGAQSPPFGRVLLVFALMAGLAWGATWLLRRYGAKLPFKTPWSALPGGPSGAVSRVTPIRHLSRGSLPGGIACHVIQTQGREVLITVTRHGVTSLLLGDAPPPKAPE